MTTKSALANRSLERASGNVGGPRRECLLLTRMA